MPRFEPELDGEAGLAEIQAVLLLGGAQFGHAGEMFPHALLASPTRIERQDVRRAAAAQTMGQGERTLAAADDEDIQTGFAAYQGRHHPGTIGVGEEGKFAARLRGKGPLGFGHGHAFSVFADTWGASRMPQAGFSWSASRAACRPPAR